MTVLNDAFWAYTIILLLFGIFWGWVARKVWDWFKEEWK